MKEEEEERKQRRKRVRRREKEKGVAYLPLDSFSEVLLLLHLESELDENLLQLLIHIVNTTKNN